MRLHRILPLGIVLAVAVAGCGTPKGPAAAENHALQSIHSAKSVLSYPIAAGSISTFLPPADQSAALGAPLYLFAVSTSSAKQPKPTWVLAGQSSAIVLHVYKNISDLSAHATAFHLGAAGAALRIVAAAKTGKLSLPVIGVRVRSVTSAQLRKFSVAVPAGHYTLVSVLSLPSTLHAPHASVANFVEANGKIVSQYGTGK